MALFQTESLLEARFVCLFVCLFCTDFVTPEGSFVGYLETSSCPNCLHYSDSSSGIFLTTSEDCTASVSPCGPAVVLAAPRRLPG